MTSEKNVMELLEKSLNLRYNEYIVPNIYIIHKKEHYYENN